MYTGGEEREREEVDEEIVDGCSTIGRVEEESG